MRNRRPFSRANLFILVVIFSIVVIVSQFKGCASLSSYFNDIKGDIVGISFNCQFYDNNGHQFMDVNGDKINMEANFVKEMTDDGFEYIKTLSDEELGEWIDNYLGIVDGEWLKQEHKEAGQ